MQILPHSRVPGRCLWATAEAGFYCQRTEQPGRGLISSWDNPCVDKLKLFIVGQVSSDPETWGPQEHHLVIAPTPERAKELAHSITRSVHEIPLDKERVLLTIPSEPDHPL